MFLRFDACLNGVSFADLDPAIVLRDIIELPPVESKETYQRALHSGMMVGGMTRESLSVQLVFMVREYDISARARLMDKVAQWVGNGGWLTISSRHGQRLYVTPDAPVAMGSGLKWTADINLILTAYERPYWEQQWPTVAVVTDSGNIIPTGTMPEAYVEVDVKNVGEGDLTTVTLSCGSTMIKLDGLTVPPQAYVRIYYTDDDLMVIEADGKSALANRTAESSDDLIAMTRKSNALAVVADQAVSAVFRARGRYR